MTSIISTLFISLDGVAEIDPQWHFPYFDNAMGAAVGGDYAGVDVLLLGRVTYDSFAGAWPDREAAGGDDAGFARQLGDTRKLVATRGETELGWRNVEATSDLLGSVAALRTEPGIEKVLVAGSISILRQLLIAGELDELRLFLHPVAANSGQRLFDESIGLLPLKLLHSAVFPSGVVRLCYAPAERPEGGSHEGAVEKVPAG